MTRDELIQLAGRSSLGPLPTPQKEVYAHEGDVHALLADVAPAIVVRMRVTDACERNRPVEMEELPICLALVV